jgi:hypothetical protein
MNTVPSSSMEMSAPVSSWIWLMILPLGPMTSPILSIGTLTVMMRGRERAHLVGGVDGLGHDVEDVQARLLGLGERRGEHRGRDPVQLGVELDRRDELPGAGDLEVHVAEGVLRTEDVGQGGVRGLAVDGVGDQAHRDAGDRGAQRHAGVEQRHGGRADRAHRGRPVGAESLGDLTDRVGEVLAAGQDRGQGALGEHAVADLAALGAADTTGLARAEGREVVVVHVALGLDRPERVDLLLELEHVERGDAHDLGVAALEQRRPVHPGQDLDLGGQLPDVGQAAAVDPDLVGEHALADQALGHRTHGGGQLPLATLEGVGQGLQRGGLDLVETGLALELVGHLQRRGQVGLGGGGHGLVGVRLVGREQRVVPRRLGSGVGQGLLRLDEDLEEGLGGLEPGGDDLLRGGLGTHGDLLEGGVGGLGLDHHDGDVAGVGDPARDDHAEHGLLDLVVGGEGDPLALDERDPHPGDGAREGQARQLGGQRRRVDRDHVVGVLRVERQHADDDLDLVAEAVDERRAQRAVDQAAGEDRLGARTALAAEERARDLTGGVHALLDVHREGEEVEVALGLLAGGGRAQQHGLVVQVGDGGTSGQPGEATGLEADGAGAETTVVDHGLGGVDVYHGVFSVLPPSGAPRSSGLSSARGRRGGTGGAVRCMRALSGGAGGAGRADGAGRAGVQVVLACRAARRAAPRREPPWCRVSDEGRDAR